MDPVTLVQIAVSIAYPILEYWLGKTGKVKPGSVIEAVLLLPTLFKGKDNGKDGDRTNGAPD